MFGKKKKVEVPVESVNPEILQSEKAYRREKLLVESRPVIQRVLLFLWTLVDVILLAIVVGYLGYYIISGSAADKARVASIGEDISQMHEISAARAAQDYSLGSVQTFFASEGYYDFYTTIENPNQLWYGTFTYFFTSEAGSTASFAGSVMPGEVRPLLALHQSVSQNPTSVEVVIEDFTWIRVDAGEVVDVNAFLQTHNQFTVTDSEYHFDVEIEGEGIPRASFTITNNTPYGYWTPEFIVVLRRAGVIAGINTVTIPGLEAGETRRIDLNWFGAAPSSGAIEVIPNINYFDEEVYMPLQTGTGSDVRDEVGDRRR